MSFYANRLSVDIAINSVPCRPALDCRPFRSYRSYHTHTHTHTLLMPFHEWMSCSTLSTGLRRCLVVIARVHILFSFSLLVFHFSFFSDSSSFFNFFFFCCLFILRRRHRCCFTFVANTIVFFFVFNFMSWRWAHLWWRVYNIVIAAVVVGYCFFSFVFECFRA